MPAKQQIWLKEPVSAPYNKNTLHLVNFNTIVLLSKTDSGYTCMQLQGSVRWVSGTDEA